MMNRNNEFYIKYTSLISQHTYKDRVKYFNALLMYEYTMDKNDFLSYLQKLHPAFGQQECKNIIEIIKQLNFSKEETNISFFNILLDTSVDVMERAGIIKRKALIMSFLYNVEREWYSMGYNEEFLKLISEKSEFLISLAKAKMESKDLEPLIKRNIKIIEFNNKIFDVNIYIEAFRELAHYNGYGIHNMLKSEFKEAQTALKDIITFRAKAKRHLKSINMEEKQDMFLNTLINNKKGLFYLYNNNYFKIKDLVNLNNQKEKSLLLDYMNGFELYQFVNYAQEFELDDELKNKSSALTFYNFIKGGNKSKDHKFYKRDNIAYTLLEKMPSNNFTNAFVEFCSKRDKYIEYYRNRYFRSNSGIDNYKFKVNAIEYSKVEQRIANKRTKDFSPYDGIIYEHNYTFTNEVEDNVNSVLLKLNLNLPRHELEYFINEFLNEYHKNNVKMPKSEKTRALKIRKIIDIIFIYDGKMLNISNEDIIDELQKCDEDYKENPLDAKRMSNATFQKYLNISIELIDNKGYLEIAKGNKSVFDII